MKNVWCVRAEFGTHTKDFIAGGYAAVDYGIGESLANAHNREEIAALFRKYNPTVTSNVVVGQQVGQIARLLFEAKPGDYIITPAADTEYLQYGVVSNRGYCFVESPSDGCRYRHRIGVEWAAGSLSRTSFSVPFQNTIRSSLTVFGVSQQDEFLEAIGQAAPNKPKAHAAFDAYETVLGRVLELDATEFELLVGHLLTALGFEESKVTGKTGDGGVDATGVLNVSGLAKVNIYVQAKRYKRGSKISANVVKQLRTAIPSGGQGAFITTADFQGAAAEVANEVGFPRIGLINGKHLVDLLVEHWNDIPEEFQTKLGLRIGLIVA